MPAAANPRLAYSRLAYSRSTYLSHPPRFSGTAISGCVPRAAMATVAVLLECAQLAATFEQLMITHQAV